MKVTEKIRQAFNEQGLPEKHHEQMLFDILKQEIIKRIHKVGRYSHIITQRWK